MDAQSYLFIFVIFGKLLQDIVVCRFNLNNRNMNEIYLFVMKGIVDILFYEANVAPWVRNIFSFYRLQTLWIVC